MSDNRNLDIEEQLSILFDDIDDTAAQAAEETQKSTEAALDSVAEAAEAAPQAAEEAVKTAEAEIDKLSGEVKNVRESVEDAVATEAVFVEAEAPEAKADAEAPGTEEVKKSAADDTKIKGDEYKGIDFDSFESVIGDDDDEDALIPEDLPVKPGGEREADDEFDDDDEEDEDEIGGKRSTPNPASSRRSTKVRETSEDRKKESARFWIFTAIVALIVAGAVLFILWSRGIIGGGREAKPSSTEPSSSETQPSSSETEPSTEPTQTETEPVTESEPEDTVPEESQDEETGEVSAQAVLDNYSNPFMVTGTGTLNVREQPDTGAKIIGTIDEFGGGDLLEQAGEWFKISSGGITGYVNGAYIAGSADITDIIAEHAVQQVRINAENGVNVRRTPGDGEIIDQVYNNSLWEYLGEEEGFYKIRYNDIEGYVSMDYSTLGWFLKEAERYYE